MNDEAANDMDVEELTAKVIRLEALQDQQRREIARVEQHAEGERMSLLENINRQGELIVRLDTVLRGANGDNGVCSRVNHLAAKLEISDARFEGMLERSEQHSNENYRNLRRWIWGLMAVIAGAVVVRYLLGL